MDNHQKNKPLKACLLLAIVFFSINFVFASEVSYSYSQIYNIKHANLLGNVQTANQACIELDSNFPVAVDMGIPTDWSVPGKTVYKYDYNSQRWVGIPSYDNKQYTSIIRELTCRSLKDNEIKNNDLPNSDIIELNWKDDIDPYYVGKILAGNRFDGTPAGDHIGQNIETLNKVCSDLGYYGVVYSSDNRNYFEEGDDTNFYYTNKKWSTTCTGPTCNDGANARTAVWWLACKKTPQPQPTPECADGIDNDNDGQIDSADAGCWDDPANPNTYNPDLDDEGRTDITCFTNTECGSDIFLGNVCQGTDLFAKYNQKTCNNPGTGISTCSANTVTNFLNACTFGCSNNDCNPNPNACTTGADCSNQNYETNPYCASNGNVYKDVHAFTCALTNTCQETTNTVLVETCSNGCLVDSCIIVNPPKKECEDTIDNDNDGLTDAQDPGCWDDTSDPSTYNPNLDDESRKNPECFVETDCGTDGYSGPFCGNGNVLKTYTDYTCNVDYTCSYTTTNVLHEMCSIGCSSGNCVGNPDTDAPIVEILTPQNGSTVSGNVTVNYTATDNESSVKECRLLVNNVETQIDTSISTSVNSFFQTFAQVNTFYTLTVGCYDTADNYGTDEVTFYYESQGSCTLDSDCGNPTTNLVCKNDDVYERTTTPVCSTNTCSSAVTDDFVEECRYGCLNGRCKDNDDNDNDDDDDENPIIIYANPIIKDNNKTVELDNVLFLAEPVVLNESKTQFNWLAFFIWLLIIAIIIVIILIVLFLIL